MDGLGLWVTLASLTPGLLVLHATDCVSFCFGEKLTSGVGFSPIPGIWTLICSGD